MWLAEEDVAAYLAQPPSEDDDEAADRGSAADGGSTAGGWSTAGGGSTAEGGSTAGGGSTAEGGSTAGGGSTAEGGGPASECASGVAAAVPAAADGAGQALESAPGKAAADGGGPESASGLAAAVSADGSAVGPGVAGDPAVLVGEALGVLGRLNGWLARASAGEAGEGIGAAGGPVDVESVRLVVDGLAGIDAALAAARLRAVVTADQTGLPSVDGAASLSAWIADRWGLTGSTAAREVRLAIGLVDEETVLDQLQAGVISRDHAAGLVAAAEKQAADQDAAARVEAARQDAEREERRRADEQAQAEAASMAERMRLAREAAAREEQLARERAERDEQQAAANEAARKARQDALLDSAVQGASPDQVRTDANRMRAADAAALERAVAAQRARRSVTFRPDGITGQRVMRVVLTDADYELVQSGIEAAHTFDPPGTPEDERRTAVQRRYDAFLDLLAAGLKAGELPTSRGTKPHVTVTVPLATLTGEAEVAGVGGFGTVISPETVRRLACDARLTRAIVDATGMPLDIGRTTRAWTTAQHTAAEQLFGGCAFPIADRTPCGRPIGWTDLHHVIWWRHDGPTDQDNGVSLCRHHHNAVHHDGWQLAFDLPTGTVTVQRTADGRTVTRRARFPHDNPRRSLGQDTPDRPGPDGLGPNRAGLGRPGLGRPGLDCPGLDRADASRADPDGSGPDRAGPGRADADRADPNRADPNRSDPDQDDPGDGRLPI
ncbi:HNH endonuclease [Euzebya pacifica]|uniref:HNH endonuclease n=1 Tax=Euzebya pacifica TaxID=1608957 RepID=A0A346Y0C3_9ACTN|nr:HNH endonuclease [Euzebya pacifica]